MRICALSQWKIETMNICWAESNATGSSEKSKESWTPLPYIPSGRAFNNPWGNLSSRVLTARQRPGSIFCESPLLLAVHSPGGRGRGLGPPRRNLGTLFAEMKTDRQWSLHDENRSKEKSLCRCRGKNVTLLLRECIRSVSVLREWAGESYTLGRSIVRSFPASTSYVRDEFSLCYVMEADNVPTFHTTNVSFGPLQKNA